jgi:pimeloyl-ACP methyl ester carboxylesterase
MGDPGHTGPTVVTVRPPGGGWLYAELHTDPHTDPRTDPSGDPHVDRAGDDDVPTVVLLHGWTVDGRLWHRQLADLPSRLTALAGEPRRLRMLVVDLRGHGRSGPITRGDATIDRLADDLDAVLDQAIGPGPGPVVLVGHSLGGMTAVEYAHRCPERFAERIAGLVLVGSSAEGARHTRYGLPRTIARAVRASELGGTGLLARFGIGRPHRHLAPALAPVVRWLVFGDVADPAEVRLVVDMVATASLRSIGAFRSAIERHRRVDALAAMRAIPVTVLVGGADRLTPPACADAIAAALGHATLRVIAGAGHMLPLERPAVVTDAIARVCLDADTTRQPQRVVTDG